MSRMIWLVEITAYDPGLPGTRTLRYCTGPGFRTSTARYMPYLVQAGTMRRDIFGAGNTFGRATVSMGEIVLANPGGALDGLLDYAFDGRAVSVWYGPQTGTYPTDFTPLLQNATMAGQAKSSREELRIALRDKLADLDVQLQTNRYAGTNVGDAGLEGGPELRGKPKPQCYGEVFNGPAVLVNGPKLIYQMKDGPVQDIPDVRDRGVSLYQTPSSWEEIYGVGDATSTLAHDFNDVACKGEDVIVGVGANGLIVYSHDGGATWEEAHTHPFVAGAAGPMPSFVTAGDDIGGDGQTGVSNTRTTTIQVSDVPNRLLLVGVAIKDNTGQTIQSVSSSLDGALTQRGTTSDHNSPTPEVQASMWYLRMPTVGTHVITVTLSGGATARMIVMSSLYRDVNQSTFGTYNLPHNNSTSPATTSAGSQTSLATDRVVDVVAKTDSDQTITVGAGQTERNKGATANATTSNNVIGGMSDEAGTGSPVTMSWTWGGGTTESWAMVTTTLNNIPADIVNLVSVDYDPVLDAFVATSDAGQMAVSFNDGVDWDAISSPFYDEETVVVRSSKRGTFVAIGTGGTVARSTDGEIFVAAADNGHTSPDASLSALVYGNGRWVTFRDMGSGGALIATSDDDGVTWDVQGPPMINDPVSGAAYGSGVYTCLSGTTAYARLYSSVDGVEWTERFITDNSSSSMGATGGSLSFGGYMQQFVAVGPHTKSSYGRLITSRDGVKWTVQNIPLPVSFSGTGVGTSDEQVVVCGSDGRMIVPVTPGTYASLADLQDNTLQPARGSFKVYAAGGYFRLGSPPDGLVTADVLVGANAAARTSAQIWEDVLTKAGKTSSDWSTADVTALDSDNSAVVGLYIGLEEVTVSAALDMVAKSPGAWWGADQENKYRIKRLEDPSAGSSVMTIKPHRMVKPLNRLDPNDPKSGLPWWAVVMRYKRNYGASNELAFAMDPLFRAELMLEWRQVVYDDDSVKTVWPNAHTQVIDSLFVDPDDALTEAIRVLQLRDQQRNRYEFSIPLNEDTLALDLGDVVTVEHPRFGLSAGKKCVVTTLEPNVEEKTLYMNVWG